MGWDKGEKLNRKGNGIQCQETQLGPAFTIYVVTIQIPNTIDIYILPHNLL